MPDLARGRVAIGHARGAEPVEVIGPQQASEAVKGAAQPRTAHRGSLVPTGPRGCQVKADNARRLVATPPVDLTAQVFEIGERTVETLKERAEIVALGHYLRRSQ